MRPKSMATVVVRLRSTPATVSMSVPGALRSSSVRRGRISVSEPTSVVLPAPNPPAIKILTATGAQLSPSPSAPGASQSSQAIGHLPEKPDVGRPFRAGPSDSDHPLLPKVGKQDADHGERQLQPGGQV